LPPVIFYLHTVDLIGKATRLRQMTGLSYRMLGRKRKGRNCPIFRTDPEAPPPLPCQREAKGGRRKEKGSFDWGRKKGEADFLSPYSLLPRPTTLGKRRGEEEMEARGLPSFKLRIEGEESCLQLSTRPSRAGGKKRKKKGGSNHSLLLGKRAMCSPLEMLGRRDASARKTEKGQNRAILYRTCRQKRQKKEGEDQLPKETLTISHFSRRREGEKERQALKESVVLPFFLSPIRGLFSESGRGKSWGPGKYAFSILPITQ